MLQAQLAAAAVHQEKQQLLQQACDVKVSVARPPHSRQPLTGLLTSAITAPCLPHIPLPPETRHDSGNIIYPQGHGVFAVHSKFGTFQVPKEFLNTNKKAPAAVAPKQAVRQVRQASICVGFTPWGPI